MSRKDRRSRRDPALHTAGVTIGLLSSMAALFFFFSGLVMHFARENVLEAGNAWLLEMAVPFLLLGIALFVVAVAAVVALR